MGWYRALDYPRVLEIMSDRDVLHEHYGDWLSSAEEGEAQLIGEGLDVARVDPEAFLGWCRLTGVDTVAASRSEYVVALLSAGAATILPRR